MTKIFYADIMGNVPEQPTELYMRVKGSNEEIDLILESLNKHIASRDTNNYDKFWSLRYKEISDPDEEDDFLSHFSFTQWLNEELFINQGIDLNKVEYDV